MSAAPARRSHQRSPELVRAPARRPASSTRASRDRRQRERHFRRRRRDLLEDAAFALLATIILISATAGLGVLALLEIPMVGIVVGSIVAERMIRKRRAVPVRSRPRRAQRR
ncbi:MAG: hypothetical protein M3016_09455 [Actinomycetota bacterium]|nr:hypothetical protein [Actinomycetota bacterium]